MARRNIVQERDTGRETQRERDRELPHQWLSEEWGKVTQSPRSYIHESLLFFHCLYPEPPLIPSKTLVGNLQSVQAFLSPGRSHSFCSSTKAGQSQELRQRCRAGKASGRASESWWLGSQPVWMSILLKNLTTAVLELRIPILSWT